MKKNISKYQLINRYSPEMVISQLQDHIAERRKQRIDEVLDNRLDSIQLAMEMPAGLHNAFAAVRSCDVFGVAKIHMIAPEWQTQTMRSISKGAMDWVEVVYYESLSDFLNVVQQENLFLAGATPLAEADVSAIPIETPVCLLFGNEKEGLSQQAQLACQLQYKIPMYGMTGSLNVSVAAAISLYETTQRKRKQLQSQGDLIASRRRQLQAQYYISSVNTKLVNALFPQYSDAD